MTKLRAFYFGGILVGLFAIGFMYLATQPDALLWHKLTAIVLPSAAVGLVTYAIFLDDDINGDWDD